MNFSFLEGYHKAWQDILVIGKTIKHDNGNCHIIGMTLSDEANLYLLEPYSRPENTDKPKKGIRTQRRSLRENEDNGCSYLHCSDFYLGEERLQVEGGNGGSLEYSEQDYGVIQLFMDMISAGWMIPEWLKNTDWNDLQLVTLRIAGLDRLPSYSPEMPITIKHHPTPIRHILEKTVTLQVGKSRTFSFYDHCGDKVLCYVNQVTLIDVWKKTEEEFNDPQLAKRLSPEQIKQARKFSLDALGQNCPKGMCYIGIEYECSKDISLGFYAKQLLSSRPKICHGSSSFLMMRLKPDKETGTHGLALKGCMIQTPFSPDTTVVPAELFHYYEKVEAWTETVI